MFSLTLQTISDPAANINKVHHENKKNILSQHDQEFISKEGILKFN